MTATRNLGALTGTGADADAAQAMLAGAAVTTSAPTYVTGTVNALSLDAAGNLRTVAGAGTAEIGKVNWRHINVLGATLTRPANQTPYSANDSISDNGTAGSVTALTSNNLSDVNDDPIVLTELMLDSSDTGPGTAGAQIRVWLYNSDPTASSGVSGGDNAAYSNKKAGFIGSFVGTMKLFSDGSRGRLLPEEGAPLMAFPASGAKNLWYQVQTLTAFTPSANSSTLAVRFKGYQGRN